MLTAAQYNSVYAVTDASISDMLLLQRKPVNWKSELRLHRNSKDPSSIQFFIKICGLVSNALLPSKASTCHGNNEVDNQL
jgi:hypothetical protein